MAFVEHSLDGSVCARVAKLLMHTVFRKSELSAPRLWWGSYIVNFSNSPFLLQRTVRYLEQSGINLFESNIIHDEIEDRHVAEPVQSEVLFALP